jgi:transposase
MAMGTRRKRQCQQPLWMASEEVVRTPANAFYDRLSAVLESLRFDEHCEHLCRRYYKGPYGRPSIAPGVYFRMLLIGYFEGIDSERGIAWRVADSLSLRKFIGYRLDEETPDHSCVSRTRRLFWVETHKAVFRWILNGLVDAGLAKGQTVSVDATTLEANAAMKAIVRRDSGETYETYLRQLARAEGIENPTREQLARFDRRRKKRTTSNDDWTHPRDPDARITKMKDGRTHLAHKAEHAVDLATGALLAVTIQAASDGDTTTVDRTLREAQQAAEMVSERGIEEVVADKGYHSGEVLKRLHMQGVRSYIPEPERGRRRWDGKRAEQKRTYENRRRVRADRGKQLQKARGELTERSFAHVYDTGGMRRLHLRGRENILKRVVIQAGAFNLGLLMRHLTGVGKPKGMSKAGLVRLTQALRNRFIEAYVALKANMAGFARSGNPEQRSNAITSSLRLLAVLRAA